MLVTTKNNNKKRIGSNKLLYHSFDFIIQFFMRFIF